ncbi:pyrimidine dimer DNA glycosylase/endonuclease V [Desulfurivibrio sp. D14AmB]|uniref:pyrimidine dimer DNA glycosylase/endonuclease V n=1 Tax=Desulfurivibrio sp. D14AmB TaxID=3374370 RepID=UPI00376ED9A1
MRVWDIHPGYLNRLSLLGEHRELHGIVAIISQGKKGYSRHPETRRWAGHGWALAQRHRLLACEMALRGFTDRSPVELTGRPGSWPVSYLDVPAAQFARLAEKYRDKEPGRPGDLPAHLHRPERPACLAVLVSVHANAENDSKTELLISTFKRLLLGVKSRLVLKYQARPCPQSMGKLPRQQFLTT